MSKGSRHNKRQTSHERFPPQSNVLKIILNLLNKVQNGCFRGTKWTVPIVALLTALHLCHAEYLHSCTYVDNCLLHC